MEGSFTGEGGMENRGSITEETSKRVSLKSQSRLNYPIWKDKLRENCYKRVREDRNRLMWKMRLSTPQSPDQKGFIKSAFEEIVSDEIKKIKDLPGNSLETSISASDFDNLLWEYDGLPDTYQGDCEEILLQMQQIFYEDLRADTTTKESDSQIETWEDEEEKFLASLVFENIQLNDEQKRKQIWCPICKRGELLENHRLIYCSFCELQLNKNNEVNLNVLQDRLAAAHLEHFDRGCKLTPKFCIETRFNLKALYISCDVCNTFEIIV